MIVKCEGDLKPLIEEMQLHIVNQTPDGYYIKVREEAQASAFLSRLIESGMPIIRYELREPSLHELFVEKAGGNLDEEK